MSSLLLCLKALIGGTRLRGAVTQLLLRALFAARQENRPSGFCSIQQHTAIVALSARHYPSTAMPSEAVAGDRPHKALLLDAPPVASLLSVNLLACSPKLAHTMCTCNAALFTPMPSAGRWSTCQRLPHCPHCHSLRSQWLLRGPGRHLPHSVRRSHRWQVLGWGRRQRRELTGRSGAAGCCRRGTHSPAGGVRVMD